MTRILLRAKVMLMIDTAQTALFLVIIVLTVLLVVLGIQVYFILRELRTTIRKANKVLDDTATIAESVSGPLSMVSSLTAGMKAGGFLASFLKRKTTEKKKN